MADPYGTIVSANQEPTKEFKMAAPMQGKVGHAGKQPTRHNGELGLVSEISMATRIEQIDNIKYGENLRKSGAPSTMTVQS